MMKWNLLTTAVFLTLVFPAGGFTDSAADGAGLSRGESRIQTASQKGQFSFILFYRQNDATTQSMQRVVSATLSDRQEGTMVPVQISDPAEQGLVKQFDATRIPMPAVAVLAPNGAVTSVFPQRVTSQHLNAAIVSRAQAGCLKALQDRKIVLLCVQPGENHPIPLGVKQFQADPLFRNRTAVVTVQSTNLAEARFLQQLKIRTDQSTPMVAFMAPPGVMLGIYNANVSHKILAEKLAAAGKCCDDKNCKHHKPSSR